MGYGPDEAAPERRPHALSAPPKSMYAAQHPCAQQSWSMPAQQAFSQEGWASAPGEAPRDSFHFQTFGTQQASPALKNGARSFNANELARQYQHSPSVISGIKG